MANGTQKKTGNQTERNPDGSYPRAGSATISKPAPIPAPEPVSHGGYDGGSSSSSAAPKSVKAASGPLELKNGMTIKALPRFTVELIAPDGAVPQTHSVTAESAEEAQEKVRKMLNM